jgi:hypothetical protein
MCIMYKDPLDCDKEFCMGCKWFDRFKPYEHYLNAIAEAYNTTPEIVESKIADLAGQWGLNIEVANSVSLDAEDLDTALTVAAMEWDI